MEYSHRYLAYPTQEIAGELERHIDIHRQACNYNEVYDTVFRVQAQLGTTHET